MARAARYRASSACPGACPRTYADADARARASTHRYSRACASAHIYSRACARAGTHSYARACSPSTHSDMCEDEALALPSSFSLSHVRVVVGILVAYCSIFIGYHCLDVHRGA